MGLMRNCQEKPYITPSDISLVFDMLAMHIKCYSMFGLSYKFLLAAHYLYLMLTGQDLRGFFSLCTLSVVVEEWLS